MGDRDVGHCRSLLWGKTVFDVFVKIRRKCKQTDDGVVEHVLGIVGLKLRIGRSVFLTSFLIHKGVFGLYEGAIGRYGRLSGSHWSPCALSMWAHALALFTVVFRTYLALAFVFLFNLSSCFLLR